MKVKGPREAPAKQRFVIYLHSQSKGRPDCLQKRTQRRSAGVEGDNRNVAELRNEPTQDLARSDLDQKIQLVNHSADGLHKTNG